MLRLFKKVKNVLFIFLMLILLALLLSRGHIYDKEELEYGVTFSKKQAVGLGLDWQEMYLSILNELNISKLRLAAYWNEIEYADNNYWWQDLDWQIEQAGKKNVKIILAVGGRLPRWPECHWPDWAKKFTKDERQQQILSYLREVVERYRDKEQIVAWQVENEPFLEHFSDCPKLDKSFLDKEIALVRELDQRPIIITDSGELSVWVQAARRADIFGTTMYRDAYSRRLKRYVHYPIRPGFFRFKKNITRLFAKPDKWIVIELQAEPWGPKSYHELTKAERDRTMNLEKFKEIIEFSRLAGFKEFYLWGVEWWYWEREVNGDSSLWDEAHKLFE